MSNLAIYFPQFLEKSLERTTDNTSSGTTLELTQNPSSVDFLHQSDNTWKQLVSPATLPEEAKAWERANNMVYGWILRSLGPATTKSVMLLTTDRDVWKDLDDRCGQSSVAQLYSLQQDLANIGQGNDYI